jgi:hypothetical protein
MARPQRSEQTPDAEAPADDTRASSKAAVLDISKPPEGYEQASGDLAGYWESASPPSRNGEEKHGSDPVLFIPLWATLSDSQLDRTKSSTLVHGRLEAPCKLRSANKEEGYVEFPKGTLFGIWTKPGMRALQNFCGATVWMRNGIEVRGEIQYFKEVDKPSPMVLFDIRNKGTGTKLKVREDRREHSLPAAARERRAAIAEDLGDIPF